MQALKHCNLALTKLKLLTEDRPLEAISETLKTKCNALGLLDLNKESLECTKEWYTLWAMERGPANPNTIDAAFYLIQSLIFNEEWEQAELFARTLWEILNSNTHHFEEDRIPDDKQQVFLARGAKEYARAILSLAKAGGIPPEKKQKAGEDAIALARRSVEMHTQVCGTDSSEVASAMGELAKILDYFNDVDDIEVIRLQEQVIAIFTRLHGNLSSHVAVNENNFAAIYVTRATRAQAANVLDRQLVNLELALPHCREAARICRAINHMDKAYEAAQAAIEVEERIRQVRIRIATTGATIFNSKG